MQTRANGGENVQVNQSLDRTLDILECFTAQKPKIGLSELARIVDLPKATVYRIAETLRMRGYLVKSAQEQSYELGYKVLTLSNALVANLDYRQVSLPYMQKIRSETNESVTLYIEINSRERLCVERLQSTHGLSRIVNVGEVLPLDKGAPGKVLLAYKDQGTLFDCSVASAELQIIRDRGYAISHAEREAGVSAVAAPLLNQHFAPVAALSISGPSFRYHGSELTRFIEIVVDAALCISRALGCPK